MLEVADLLAIRPVSDARISPDGRRVAFVIGAALDGPHATPEGNRGWLSYQGASTLHAWDRIFYDVDPYERDGIYARRSPVLAAAGVTTPVLILHGDQDRVVPPDQDHGIETPLVLYPGAGHGPHEPRHVRDVLERSLAWLARRLT